jgi:hypothetical protein
MGSMSASDAAPLPRLGEVFFDVRGNSRSMRLSWYADTGVAVFSIWQGGMCTGTFRLAIGDLPRMVETLQRGPGEQSPGVEPADSTQAFSDGPRGYGDPRFPGSHSDTSYPSDASYPAARPDEPYPGRRPDASYSGVRPDPSYPGARPDPSYPAPGSGAAYPGALPDPSYPDADSGTSYPGAHSGTSYPGAHSGTSYPGAHSGAAYPGARSDASYPGTRTDASYPGARPDPSYPGPGGAELTGPGRYQGGRADGPYLAGTGPMDFADQPLPAHYPPGASAYPAGTSAPGHGGAPGRSPGDYLPHYSAAVEEDVQSPPPESFPYGQPPGNRGPTGRHADPDTPFD